jgi:thiamine biosynthesis protein ThiI
VNNELIIIRYGEIALKAKHTRKHFENILIRNIKNALKMSKIDNNIIKEWGRLYLNTDNINESILILKNIFGIVSLSPAIKIETDINQISNIIIDVTKNILTKNNSFALRVNRVGIHNFTSQDIAIKIGNDIVSKTGSKVNLTSPNYEIFIDIRNEITYIFLKKIPGVGGMPLGSQGNVLAIICDKKSILAAWYLIRRGCKAIFYLKNKKINDELLPFCDRWFIDKNIFLKNVKNNRNMEISDIIKKENCQAIVTGYTINDQSNTIMELRAIKKIYNLPVLCPLIIMNKNEILNKLKKIEL